MTVKELKNALKGLPADAEVYVERGLSMAEAVTERFGAEAMEFLDKLL